MFRQSSRPPSLCFPKASKLGFNSLSTLWPVGGGLGRVGQPEDQGGGDLQIGELCISLLLRVANVIGNAMKNCTNFRRHKHKSLCFHQVLTAGPKCWIFRTTRQAIIFIRLFFLISLVNFKPQVTALEYEVFQRAGDRYFCIFLLCKKKTCSLLFVFVLKEIKCILQGFGIFNAFFFRTGKASLIQRARTIQAQFPPELKNKKKNIQ